MKYLTLLLALLAVSCSPKVSKHPVSVGPAPTPVAPVVQKAIPSVDRATEKNVEAKVQVAELKNQVEVGKKKLSSYGDQLSKLIQQGKADKVQLEALYGSLEVVRENADIAYKRIGALTQILKDQEEELRFAKDNLNEALAKAFVTDTEAKRAFIDLKASTKQVETLSDRNDKLMLDVASAEQRGAMYGKWLAILAAIGILYIAFRLAKAHPATKPFFFWVP